jgi:hypothetical protein
MATETPLPPFRQQFDRAQEPYSARNALGITFDVTAVTARFNSAVQQVITSSGTYTPTSGMKFAIIECVGGGGGGGAVAGTAGNTYVGGGGGAGGYSRVRVTAAQVGASQTVTIGAGGNGGAAGSNNGSPGGDTSVGSLCVAKGGSGGGFCSVASGAAGGLGGVAGTGDLSSPGAPGGTGFYNATANSIFARTGIGGSSIWGGGGRGNVAGATDGEAAPGVGGGGGGALTTSASNFAGGNGKAGAAVITEFIGT